MWGTSCGLLKPSLSARDCTKKLHFQKANIVGFHGVLADVCAGLAMPRRPCTIARLALAAFLVLGITKQMESTCLQDLGAAWAK